ncbi:hypothetical protein C3L33_19826, partial [Rhododendron williamsianum]
MLRGYSLVIGPSVTTNTNTTTDEPRKNGLRRGKWALRSVRRPRGQRLSLKLEPTTPISKRTQAGPSPTPSANSVTGENNVQMVLF